ncbi:MAG: hypothetical protein IK997_07795 [Bacilli bacterium]|nr:hypothetical protein [Bacilli bacterium]
MKLKDLKRRSRSKKIILTIAMILVMAMGVGYAYLRDTLAIDNNTKMSVTWNVYFDNVQKLGNSMNPATTPSLNKTSFSTTLNFTDVSQVYETKFDVKNEGSLDAMVTSFTTNPLPEELQSYFDASVTYGDGIAIANNNLLAHGSSDSFKIKISIKDGVNVSDLPSSIPISVTVNYGKADSNATEREIRKIIELPTGKTKDTLAVGDEICINGDTTECFNFIRYDGDNIVMLSKWNLNVGDNSKGTETFLQDSDVRGYVSSEIRYGNVAFSATNYWSTLGLTYPADVYDNTYKTAPDFSANGYTTEGYSVAYYVEKYKKILEDYGVVVKNARLLTYSEATDSSIGCDNSSCSCPTGFITNTLFWLGSADNDNVVWYVRSGGYFSFASYSLESDYGVRPVIEISKSDI